MATTCSDVDVAALAAAVGDAHAGLAAESVWRLPEADLLPVCGSLAPLRAQVEADYLRAVAEVDRRRPASRCPTASAARAAAWVRPRSRSCAPARR